MLAKPFCGVPHWLLIREVRRIIMPKGRKRRRSLSSPIHAYSIKEFCELHGISVAHFYVLRTKGLAPREMRVGRRWLISAEAAAEWRKAREAQ